MTDIVKSSVASMDVNQGMKAPVIAGLYAGEDIGAVAPCYIGSDGKIYMSVSTQCTISGVADVHGFAPKVTVSGAALSLYGAGARFEYGSELTPGTYLYVSDTAGALSDVAVAASDIPCALVINTTDIVVLGAK